MGIIDQYLATQPATPAAGSDDSEITKGLRSGYASAKGQLQALAGTGAELVGANDFAKARYADSAADQTEAQLPENKARVGSFSDIHNLRDAFDYGAHQLGSSAPVLGAGLATIAATRGRVNPLVAGTAAATPFTTGGAIEQQQADPEAAARPVGMRAVSALTTGATQAALMNAVPVAAGGKLLGAAAGEAAGTFGGRLASNLAEGVGGNALAGAASEKLGQNAQSLLNPNRDTSGDTDAIKEAAAGGAITGLPFAGLGLAGDTLHGKSAAPRTDGVPAGGAEPGAAPGIMDKINAAVAAAKEKVTGVPQEPVTAPVEGSPIDAFNKAQDVATGVQPLPDSPTNTSAAVKSPLLDRIKNAFAAKPEEVDLDTAQKVAAGQETVDPEALRAAPPEQQGQILQQADASRIDQVGDWAKQLLAKGKLSDDQQTQLQAATADLADKGNQAVVAGLKVAQDLGEKAKSVAQDFLAKASEKYDAVTQNKKLSDVDNPQVQAKIADTIAPALADTFPQLVQNDTALKAVTNGLRKTMAVMQETGKVDPETATQLRTWFGDNAPSVMSALHGAVLDSGDKAGSAKYFDAVSQLLDHGDAAAKMEDHIRNALPPEVADTVTPNQLSDMAGHLREYVNGDHTSDMPDSQASVTNRLIDTELRNQFGDKTDSLLDAFRKEAEDNRAKSELETNEDASAGGTDDTEAPDARDVGITTHAGEPEQDTQYLGGGKNADAPEPVRSPEAHRAEFGNESQAERLQRQAQIDNPDSVVEFKKISDLPDDVRAKYPDAGPDDGLVTVGGTKSDFKMTGDEFKSSLVDTSKTSHAQNNASRIDTGVKGAVIDARALTKTMQGKLKYNASDDISSRHRTARAFMEGIADAQDRLGKSFDVPDSTVIAPGFTYGEAKRLSMREPDPAWMKGKTDKEINTELHTRDALKDMSDREVSRAVDKAHDVLASREGELQDHIAELKASNTKFDKDSIAELRKSFGVDNARAAVAAAEREVQTRSDAVRKAQNLDDAGRTEAGTDEQVHTAADNNAPKDLVRKTGLDDNALRLVKSPTEERNLDGGFKPSTINAIDSKINRLENLKSADGKKMNLIAQKLGAKARDVFDKFNQMTKVDQAMLASIIKEGKVSAISETINPLYEKYKGVTAAKKDNAFADKILGKGDLAPVHKEIAKSDDPATLQRAVDSLAEHAGKPRADEVLASLNDRLGKLVQDPETAYNMQRAGGATEISPNDKLDVKQHIEKVLGKSVDVEFAKMLHEGEFVRDPSRVPQGMAQDVIKVSVHSQDPMSTAYHESLHGFLAKLGDDGHADAAAPLFKAATSPEVQAKLRKLLAGQTDALKQLATPEEAAAYMYQFHEAGALDLTGKAKTITQKLGDFFRKALGMWTNDERAVNIMNYFSSGEYAKNASDRNAVSRALNEGTLSKDHFARQLDKLKSFVGPLDTLATRVISTGDSSIRSLKNAALNEMLDKVYSPLQGEHDDVGYLPTSRAKRTQVLNDLAKNIGLTDPAHVTDALEAMQRGEKAQTPEGRLVQREVRKTLDSMYEYMNEAGVKMGDLGYGKDYFPRVWDSNKVLSNEQGFRDMLQQYKDSGKFSGSVDQIMAALTRGDGSEMTVETAKPGNQFAKERILGFISAKDAQPFLNGDMYQTLNSYVTQGTRRAEWARRFGDDGAGLKKIFEDARAQGATDDHILRATKFLKGVDGTLGDNIDPDLRRAFGNAIVYQNLRILPLMIFSSTIDAGGIMVRGGTVGEAFNTFKRGIKEIPQGFKKVGNRTPDAAYSIAETMGTIDSAVLMHTLGTSYSQGMTSDIGRKINDTLFKYNLAEQYNVSMRVGATEAAVNFLGRHADGSASAHSARWLAELGYKPGEIEKGADGKPLLTAAQFEAAGASPAAAQTKADKISLAVNKWVDGAILRPNAAHKPIWMNDPHFALVAHLKQFVYSFQETILKRVANEARHGNLGPAYALASYVPFMLAADVLKGAAVSGGGVPSNRENWGAGDYAWYEAQRAGLFGVGQFGLDVAKGIHRGGTGISALTGPTIEQLGDAASVIAGPQQFKTFAMNALPANQLLDAAGEASASTNASD